MSKRQIQYTVRNVPPRVDRALRRKAGEAGKSLNELALEALAREAGLGEEAVRYFDLDELAGTWEADPACEEALAEQRRIDEDMWQ